MSVIPQFWTKGVQFNDGCTKVSPGCKNCWSEAMAARFKRVPEVLTDGHFNGKVHINMHLLEKAAKRKKPEVYAIWNDLYHEGVTDEQIFKALAIMMGATHHTFLIVTKRVERAAIYMPEFMDINYDYALKRAPEAHPVHLMDEQTPLMKTKFFRKAMAENMTGHIWHIVTCENQAMADKRIPHLLRIPGKRAIIIEPMLEEIDFDKWKQTGYYCNTPNHGALCPEGIMEGDDGVVICRYCENPIDIGYGLPFHQVICGPENGTGKRPFDPAWADSVKAQCEAAGVPFYRKDTGEGALAWRTP